MNKVLRPKSHKEWLTLRMEGIGSSEVASILGLNPFQTPYQLWRKKTGQDAPSTENVAMRRGHWCEDAVAQYFGETTKHEIIKRSITDWLIRDVDKPYLQVSPDRTYWLASDGVKHGKFAEANKGILECKTTNLSVDPDNIPVHWFCQLQYQLGVAGYKKGALAWMSRGFQFGHVEIEHDEGFFAWLVEKVDAFWNDNILGGKEPAAINAQDIICKFARHTDGKCANADDEIYQHYLDVRKVKEEIAALEDRKAQIEEEIKLHMADAEALIYQGDTLATWKSPKESMKFDEKAFKAEHPELWKQYAKCVQGSRRFLLK